MRTATRSVAAISLLVSCLALTAGQNESSSESSTRQQVSTRAGGEGSGWTRFPQEEGNKGSGVSGSNLAIIAIGVLAVVAMLAIAVAAILMNRRPSRRPQEKEAEDQESKRIPSSEDLPADPGVPSIAYAFSLETYNAPFTKAAPTAKSPAAKAKSKTGKQSAGKPAKA